MVDKKVKRDLVKALIDNPNTVIDNLENVCIDEWEYEDDLKSRGILIVDKTDLKFYSAHESIVYGIKDDNYFTSEDCPLIVDLPEVEIESINISKKEWVLKEYYNG